MNIGGFLPLSLIDFPGTPSAIVFTNGCQLKCPFCHNKTLASGTAPNIPEDYVKDELRKLRGKVQGVVISGGEPTLQPDLWEFCKWCKDEGFKVKLDTNGTRMLHHGFTYDVLDYIAVDIKHFSSIYIQKFFRNFDYEDSEINFRSFAYDMENMEFRITCVRPFIYEEVLFGFIERLRGKEVDVHHPIYLQHCNVTPQILDPDFFASGKGRAWTQDEINSFVDKYGKKYNVKAR